MKQFLDFLPIIVFAGVFFAGGRDVLVATAALIAAQTLVMGIVYLMHRKIDRQMKLTFWAVLGLGGLTLALRDATFIQWKPTIVNWLLACALMGSEFFGERNFLERMMGSQIELPSPAWRTLAFGWSVGFFIAGALNLAVAYNFSMDVWVSYKLVGGLGLTFIYVIIMMIYLYVKGYLDQPEENVPVGDVPVRDMPVRDEALLDEDRS